MLLSIGVLPFLYLLLFFHIVNWRHPIHVPANVFCIGIAQKSPILIDLAINFTFLALDQILSILVPATISCLIVFSLPALVCLIINPNLPILVNLTFTLLVVAVIIVTVHSC